MTVFEFVQSEYKKANTRQTNKNALDYENFAVVICGDEECWWKWWQPSTGSSHSSFVTN